jgi:catechol-2,3-dioxygenase
MKLELKRVVLFVQDMAVQTAFYKDVLGLSVAENPGAKLGKVHTANIDLFNGSQLQLCDGKDPEGNVFQLSNRV